MPPIGKDAHAIIGHIVQGKDYIERRISSEELMEKHSDPSRLGTLGQAHAMRQQFIDEETKKIQAVIDANPTPVGELGYPGYDEWINETVAEYAGEVDPAFEPSAPGEEETAAPVPSPDTGEGIPQADPERPPPLNVEAAPIPVPPDQEEDSEFDLLFDDDGLEDQISRNFTIYLDANTGLPMMRMDYQLFARNAEAILEACPWIAADPGYQFLVSHACIANDIKTLEILEEHGPGIAHLRSDVIREAIVYRCNQKTMQWLLDHGVKVTPEHIVHAIERRNPDIVEMLQTHLARQNAHEAGGGDDDPTDPPQKWAGNREAMGDQLNRKGRAAAPTRRDKDAGEPWQGI